MGDVDKSASAYGFEILRCRIDPAERARTRALFQVRLGEGVRHKEILVKSEDENAPKRVFTIPLRQQSRAPARSFFNDGRKVGPVIRVRPRCCGKRWERRRNLSASPQGRNRCADPIRRLRTIRKKSRSVKTPNFGLSAPGADAMLSVRGRPFSCRPSAPGEGHRANENRGRRK